MVACKKRSVRVICTVILSAAALSIAVSAGGLSRAFATESVEEPAGTSSQEESGAAEDSESEEGSIPEAGKKIEMPSSEEGEPNNDEDILNSGVDGSEDIVVTEPVAFQVPIYNYDIVNVVVPTSYAVALNPYEMTVKTGEDTFSNEQVISRNYGIVNKSTRDKIVTVTLQVESGNHGKITFVDSAEAALQADQDTYALYFALVPAADGDIRVNGASIGKDTAAEAVKDVEMNRAEYEVALREGMNQVSFQLSAAVYSYIEGQEFHSEADMVDGTRMPEIKALASEGTGTTAFTFGGVMNPDADWSKLTGGLSISVIYTYENPNGGETVIQGTGAMLERQY